MVASQDVTIASENNPNTDVEMTTIKLKAPEKLSEQGITHAVFKPWRNQVIAFLQQEIINFNFCKAGKYEKWLFFSTNAQRISSLAEDDKEKLVIERKNEADKEQKLEDLLLLRESQ